ncbi:UDP-glucose 4-epimerase [Rhodobium orientis]|uniref:UDP-glucose 4-epimerase n=1 Tax=Rhodobium orientis TaxID=34017 RepID=A0A327JJS9_9HYPH|nr:UDP-glucose 4-epimerase GalE [Rhodobium orientis]MBB4305322.1 UDP-glucose 4-epimerase [Rhodobium orientis]MBK5949917.1 UDP-glucose 4-epimerase GalE [Rhodobium orientis]RAI25533.1 UDP-glucose 4-epimerase GalE [Rhodobium orientis]
MTVLVTGGAGYIGSHMVLALVEAGEDVVVLDNLSTGFREAVAPEAAFYRGDMADEALVMRIVARHDVSAIIHFAGSIVVPESVADPLGYYLNNTVKSRSLMASAVAAGVKNFLFSSTAAVYGDPAEVPVTEKAPFAPMSPYGTSKMMTEMMLADVAAAHDFTYTALRYFNVAGADPEGRTGQSTARATHLIKVACETALGKRSHLDVYGTDYPTPDGTCVRDYIHVSDLANAHLLALGAMRNGEGSAVFNCGYGKGFSVLEVVDAVKRVSGADFAVKLAPRRPGDSPQIVAGADRIRKTLGWAPKYDDLDTIVEHAFRWERHLGLAKAS